MYWIKWFSWLTLVRFCCKRCFWHISVRIPLCLVDFCIKENVSSKDFVPSSNQTDGRHVQIRHQRMPSGHPNLICLFKYISVFLFTLHFYQSNIIYKKLGLGAASYKWTNVTLKWSTIATVRSKVMK